MTFQQAIPEEFARIRAFYWHLIDEMQGQNDKIGWKRAFTPRMTFCAAVWCAVSCSRSPKTARSVRASY